MNRPELHPACAAWPPLSDEDLQALALDIQEKGLLEPVTLTTCGLLLDGRSRWDACEIAGVDPRTVVYEGDDPIGFVLSKNKHRRHLDKSQMAMIVGRLANLKNGSNQFTKKSDKSEGVAPSYTLSEGGALNDVQTIVELSTQSGITTTYINSAKAVLREGEPNIAAMVDTGQVNVRSAARVVANHARDEQAGMTPEEVKENDKKIRDNWSSNGGTNGRSKSAKGNSKGGNKGKNDNPHKRGGIIDPPYEPMKWPTNEERGYPLPGSKLEDYDDFFKKYGRTSLYPKAVADMQIADNLTAGVALMVNNLAKDNHPDVDTFFANIEHLLQHRRVPEADNGAQIDFVGKAKTSLEMLEKGLPKVIAYLTALQEKLDTRKVKVAAPETHKEELQEQSTSIH